MSDENQTLSKNDVYAPLSSYLNPPSLTPTSHGSPQEQKEASGIDPSNRLYGLLIEISRKYHGHVPSKVLRESTLDSRLMQRALTLVGGGINNSLNALNKKTKKRKREYALSNKCRKKKHLKEVLVIGSSNEQEEELSTPNPNTTTTRSVVVKKINNLPRTLETQEVLTSLNKMWNSYAKTNISTCQDIKQISSKLATNVELGGAYVRIISSNHINPKLIGQNGIILVETKNTWVIALTEYSSSKKEKMNDVVPVVRVPKLDASLAFRLITSVLPLELQANRKSENDNEVNELCVIIKGPVVKK